MRIALIVLLTASLPFGCSCNAAKSNWIVGTWESIDDGKEKPPTCLSFKEDGTMSIHVRSPRGTKGVTFKWEENSDETVSAFGSERKNPQILSNYPLYVLGGNTLYEKLVLLHPDNFSYHYNDVRKYRKNRC